VPTNRAERSTSSGATITVARAHTGRRRNDEARQAVLQATMALLLDVGLGALTIEAIAAKARVGKQTIYRWWPSKGAVVLEALTEYAEAEVPVPDTGTLQGDLEKFMVTTFRRGREPSANALLRAVMAEAQRDEAVADLLRDFTRTRRNALTEILKRARARGELPKDARLDTAVEMAYGAYWYRLLLAHAPLSDNAARHLANAVALAATLPLDS
jgi:AcrR family transcriptional regulator